MIISAIITFFIVLFAIQTFMEKDDYYIPDCLDIKSTLHEQYVENGTLKMNITGEVPHWDFGSCPHVALEYKKGNHTLCFDSQSEIDTRIKEGPIIIKWCLVDNVGFRIRSVRNE